MTRRMLLLMSMTALSSCGIEGASKQGAAPWIDAAAQSHARADAAVARDDWADAEVALSQFVSGAVPPDVAPADRRGVLQDAYSRLSRLALRRADPRAALAWAERGLELGLNSDVFSANLLIARGTAREVLAQDVSAAQDYQQALLIDEALLQSDTGSHP